MLSLYIVCREGENWYRQRQPISQFMMVPRKIGEYHEDFNSITRDLLVLLRQIRNSQTCVVQDVRACLSMWSFECKLLAIILVHVRGLALYASSCEAVGKSLSTYYLNINQLGG